MHYEGNGTFVPVEINNPTAVTVVVQPRQILCELQQVQLEDKSNSHEIELDDESFISQFDLSTTSLSEEQRSQVRSLLREYRDIFSEGEFDIGHTDAIKHKIDLLVEELVPVGPLFKELVQPIILTKSDCILC